jgi:hypothetical protein
MRFCARLALAFVVWAYIVALTGGFRIEWGGGHLSSRNAVQVVVAAAVTALLAWTLAPSGRRASALKSEFTGPLTFLSSFERSHANRFVGICAIAVVCLGFREGAFVAGGSDSYGYVSQAHLWAVGRLTIDQPVVSEFSWPFAADAFAPLGYRPLHGGTQLVPGYPSGLPLVMAMFERVFDRRAVFWVVPLLGGVAVWATYLMGARVAGPLVGTIASVLVATSPVFLLQLFSAMSDVPATAWWTLSLALVMGDKRISALAAGLFAGAAILTRPNLAPLVVVPFGLLIYRATTEWTMGARAIQRAALFSVGPLSACIAVATMNAFWYGAPLASGYGQLGAIYEWKNLWPNVRRYSTWLADAEALVVVAAMLPFILHSADESGSRRVPRKVALLALAGFVLATCAAYLLYLPFEDWSYLRFFLPAFPCLCVLAGLGVVDVIARLPSAVRDLATVVVVALLAVQGVRYARSHAVFEIRDATRQYAEIGAFIRERLPERAVFIALQHSGSARYYSGRLTVRYDAIPPDGLDMVIADLRRAAYRPYFLLEDWERDSFRERFGAHSMLAALDRRPLVTVANNSRASIYDLGD